MNNKCTNTGYIPFTGFPTPSRLRAAHEEYLKSAVPLQFDKEDVPLPFPPAQSSEDLLENSYFTLTDNRARSIKALDHALQDYQTLAEYLAEEATSDLQKVRAFFVFIGCQTPERLQKFVLEMEAPPFLDSPLFDLWITNMEEACLYCVMLQTLCKYVSIPCRIESCKTKAAGYSVGGPVFQSNDICLVYVEGAWRFIEQYWGSQSVTLPPEDEWQMMHTGGGDGNHKPEAEAEKYYGVNDYWFMLDPVQFLCSHLVENPACQLLPRPVSTEEFREMAYLHHGYFALGLTSLSHAKCVIHCKHGEVTVKLGLGANKAVKLHHAIYKSTGDQSHLVDDQKPADFSVVYNSGGQLAVEVKFPWIGKYRLDLEGSEEEGGDRYQICSYVIHVQRPCFRAEPIPAEVVGEELGMNTAARDAGVTALRDGQRGRVTARFGNANMKFALSEFRRNKMELHPHMGAPHVVRHYYDPKGNLHVSAKAAFPGKHILVIVVVKNNVLVTTLKYLIVAARPSTDFLSPRLYPPALGEGNRTGDCRPFSEGIIRPLSHPCPALVAPEDGRLCLDMAVKKGMRVVPEFLVDFSASKPSEAKEQVHMEREGNTCRITIRFPNTGLCALHIRKARNNMPLFQYVIEVQRPDMTLLPFPAITRAWPATGKITGPIDGAVLNSHPVEYDLQIPGARHVYIKQEGSMNLALLKGDGDRWYGAVDISNRASVLEVMVNTKKKRHVLMLTYQVLNQHDEAERNRAKRKKMHEIREYHNSKARHRKLVRAEAVQRRHLVDKLIKRAERDFNEHREEYEALELDQETVIAKKELYDAMRSQDVCDIHCCMISIQSDEMKFTVLKKDVAKACSMIYKLRTRTGKSYEINQTTMSEIARYSSPPHPVHHVMQACLMLLGEDEQSTERWREIQKVLNRASTYSRMESFDIDDVYPEFAARAKQLVRGIKPEVLRRKCRNSAVIYEWIATIVTN